MHLGASIMKLLLKIRYDVQISGGDLIDQNHSNLILPSHVALMDPAILYAYLREKGNLSPVVVDTYYNIPFLKPFFRKMNAVAVADIACDDGKTLDAKGIIGNLINILENKNNVLLYPQGAMARQGFQSIIGKKTAFFAAQNLPKGTKILTVNISGLRGSRSSRAWNGHSPNLVSFLLKGIWFTIANIFFFVPKRTVKIEIQDSTEKLLKVSKKGVDMFNQELEKIYNKKGEEKAEYLSGLFWYNTTKNHHFPDKIEGSIKELKKSDFNQSIKIPDKIYKSIVTIVKKIKPGLKSDINLNTNLILDCFFDSLDMSELKSSVKASFPKSSNPPLLDLKTIGDIAVMAMGISTTNEELKPCNWNLSCNKSLLYKSLKTNINSDSTILSVMKSVFQTLENDYGFCYDEILGIQTKKDFLIKAYLISNILKKFNGEKIAIMLPSLSFTSLLVVGCYLAKKVPVMLNRTQSEEAFSHCLKSQNVETILTSKSFFQKIQTPRLKGYKMTFIEDLLSSISTVQKIRALCQSKLFKIPTDLSKTAVVLFTSGSEALPKAVELSHQNILQDLLGASAVVGIKHNDVEIGFLPPFHSFGFALGIVLPLITGMRIVFTPDPNDSACISNLISHTKSTFLASTPTFLRGILDSAKNNQLATLQIVIVGAERCTKDIFTKVNKYAPNATILEGYGITECSPIIAVNPLKPNKIIKKGTAGLPIYGENVKILTIDGLEELPPNKEGMIFVRGLNIFGGYIDDSLESPFVTINGHQRYKTGDLGFIDKDGYLSISGRLKRFVKIAGEMISLPAIESVLSRKWHGDKGEVLSLEYLEKSDGTVQFILFTTESISCPEVNEYLHGQGVSNLVHIDEVRQIKEIPMLGTGKIDHVQLQKLLK